LSTFLLQDKLLDLDDGMTKNFMNGWFYFKAKLNFYLF